MTCNCLAEHWQELAAFAFMGMGIAIPIYFIFKRFVKIQRDKIRRDKLMFHNDYKFDFVEAPKFNAVGEPF